MELTDDARNRIRAEEIFRDEIRQSLNSTARRSWWDVLNSSFVMWFLGSVVLSFIVSWYAAAREAENRRAAAAVAAENAALETTRRLASIQDEILSRYWRVSLILQVDNDPYRFDRARRAIDGIGDEAGNPDFVGTSIDVLLKRFKELSCVKDPVWREHEKQNEQMQVTLRRNAVKMSSSGSAEEFAAVKAAMQAYSTFQLIVSKQLTCRHAEVMEAIAR